MSSSSLNAAGFCGSNLKSCQKRLALCKAAILANQNFYIDKCSKPIKVVDVIFENRDSQVSLMNTKMPEERAYSYIENMCLSKTCRISFCSDSGRRYSGSKVLKSNLGVGNKPVFYSLYDICGTGQALYNLDLLGIPLPNSGITSANIDEIEFAIKINGDIDSGNFVKFDEHLVPLGCLPLCSVAKADVILYCKNAESEIVPIYISHKAGMHPTDFRQWSGVSFIAGRSIYESPIVQNIKKIVDDAGGYVPGEKKIVPFYDGSQDSINLVFWSMFGPEYSDGAEKSENNVHMICFDNPSHFGGSQKYFDNGSMIIQPGSRFLLNFPMLEPCFSLRPSADREVNLHGLKIPGTRIGISPKGTFGEI